MDDQSVKEIISLLTEIRDLLKNPTSTKKTTKTAQPKKATALRVGGRTTLIRTPDFEQNAPFTL
jgi:hypothetical protein